MEKKSKSLYKVTLNWKSERQIYHTHAYTKKEAKNNAVRAMCKRLNLNYSFHSQFFNGKLDNFRIEKELPKNGD